MPNDSRNEIGFAQLGLGSVLKQYQLIVPPNQREYAWETKEVTTLLKDFSREIGEGSSFYFLGTVVTIPKIDGSLEVVDGQQRLATTAILLAAIRNFLRTKESEKELAESIENDFLSAYNRNTRSRVPKLQLNLDDNDYFRSLFQEESPLATKPSHRLIHDAFEESTKHVKSVVAGYDEKEHGSVLNRWIDFIDKKSSIILLRVPNATNAYRMFETLNDRGKRVSQSDLVKNYLFGQSGARLPEVQHRWAYMRGALETIEEDDVTIEYLRHALTVLRGFVRGPDVYDAVQKFARGEQPVVFFAGQLETIAYDFVAVQNTDHDRWNSFSPSARRAVETLCLFNLKILRPVMLAVVHKLQSRELEEALKFCVSLAVRLMISGRTRTGSVEEGLANASHALFSSNEPSLDFLKGKLGNVIPTDSQFQLAFQFATVSNAKLARYYLRSLEMQSGGESEPWHIPNNDQTIINLEHVLPEKTEGNWPQFNEDEWKSYRNRIGNLVLLRASDNSLIKSTEFAAKKLVFTNYTYATTRQVAEADEWTPETIETRQRSLSHIAVKTWPI